MDVETIAVRSGMGQTALRSAVRRRTGRGVREAVEHLRLEPAAWALRASNDTIGDVAQGVGYPDQFHFSRAFKRVYGCSPTAWRDAGAATKDT